MPFEAKRADAVDLKEKDDSSSFFHSQQSCYSRIELRKKSNACLTDIQTAKENRGVYRIPPTHIQLLCPYPI